MSVISGPNLSASDLVFAYDMYNTKSYVGAPVTNLLPNPTINSVPTTGNGWGTYNTNQYGSGAYFSIGTVSSVSGNVVTMSAAHSLRSYDVMQPQTTGGGVTAGTNYLIKKLSSTTFSLHPYNSSQDGSQGYINPATGTHKVYDDFANDVRISINSSSFPTMWWGYPHLPNSGLVKEVRINGCTIPGYPTTDCLRLYHTRPDGVTDGMAYSVDATVTAGVAHTVSFWTKTVNASAVGSSISYQIYNYGVVSPAGYSFSAVLGPVGVWTKQSMTFTPVNPYCISYFFPSSGNIIYDLAHIQFESGSTASAWTNSSRSTTQALLDLTGKNIMTVNSLTYVNDSINSFTFNGISNYITASNSPIWAIGANGTIEQWVYVNGNSGSNNRFWCTTNNPSGLDAYLNGGSYNIYFHGGSVGTTTTIPTGQWIHLVVTYNAGTIAVYFNGISQNLTGTTTGYNITNTGTFFVGQYAGGGNYYFNGKIPVTRVYNKGFTSLEILQNFNASRGRYGV